MPIGFKDPRYAYNFFHGLGPSEGAGQVRWFYPKPKYMYFVRFVPNRNIPDLATKRWNDPWDNGISFLALQVSQPQVQFVADKLNQYNRWRLIQKQRQYQAINISFIETMDEKLLDFLTGYLRYYIKEQDSGAKKEDWEQDIYKPDFIGDTGGHGYGIGAKEQKFYLSCIEVYQFNVGFYSMYQLINPLITNIQYDGMDYSSNDPYMTQVTFDYETVLWKEKNAPLTQEVADLALLTAHGQQPKRPLTTDTVITDYNNLTQGAGREGDPSFDWKLRADRSDQAGRDNRGLSNAVGVLTNRGNQLSSGPSSRNDLLAVSRAKMSRGRALAASSDPNVRRRGEKMIREGELSIASTNTIAT